MKKLTQLLMVAMRRSARLGRLAIAVGVVLTGLAVPSSIQGQGPPGRPGEPPGGPPSSPPGPGITGVRRAPYIAVTHTIDYSLRSPLKGEPPIAWVTRTMVVAINGTADDANVATYVLGNATVFRHEFQQVEAGQEAFLLPFASFGSDPNLPPSEFDALDPPYVGETIVVASDVPLIVTGAVFRGLKNLFIDFDLGISTEGLAESRRTLDVRQYDCKVPADFQRIPHFCQTFRPVPPSGTP